VFRITTECPFIAWEMVGDAWREHVARNNEITVLDGVCEGCGFEIYRLDALERAWNSAAAEERSEYANAYPRRHQDQFRIGIIDAPPPLDRMDVRLTVDYPEDLVLCRHIFRDLEDRGPLIPLADIVAYCDAHPALYDLVKPFNVPGRVWKGAATGIGLRSVVQERH
jgi:spore coat polysaccharide biosynthesis protein SpsF (cytidylyltransferase family)